MEHLVEGSAPKPEEELRTQTSVAFGFLSLKLVIVSGVRLGSTAILARLLAPDDFGVFGLALVMYYGLQVFTELGTGKFIIQRVEVDDRLLGNVWSINIAKGALVTGLLLLFAPFYGVITEQGDTVRYVLSVVSLTAFVGGFQNPRVFVAERDLAFSRVVLYEILTAIIGAIITIGLALSLQHVTALAWGMVLSMAIGTILSNIIFPAPLPRLDREHIREVLTVGRNFVIIGIGTFVMTQGDNFIVGTLLGATQLGLYMLAYRLSEIPVIVLSTVTSRLTLPVISRLQGEPDRLRAVSLRIFNLQIAFLIPCAVCLALLAEPLVTLLYGDRWLQAASILRFLSVALLGRGLTQIMAAYIIGTGNYSFSAKIKVIETVVFLLGAVVCGALWEIEGVAIGVGAAYLYAAAIRVWFVGRHVHVTLPRFIAMAGAAIGASVPAIVLTLSIGSVLNRSPLSTLLAGGLSFAIAYLVMTFLLRRQLAMDAHRTLWTLWEKPWSVEQRFNSIADRGSG